MNKKSKRIGSLLLVFCLLAALVVPACAEEEQPEKALHIDSPKAFLQFVEDCRLDSYSKDMVVYLETDLDLTDTEFTGIPIFCGTFDGKFHTVSISITNNGSDQGFFRHLARGALVQNLNVTGPVTPEGSRGNVGGLVGDNEGTISWCSFQGEVSGGDCVGGLVGLNQEHGFVEHSQASGSVSGDHFVGGLVGENRGFLENCANFAGVNTTERQNSVKLSDITLESLTKTESAKTVTDIGGVAGTSTGVLQRCTNYGIVGYQHMGYNIGGIVGGQKGYVKECLNYGTVYGRKDVGGIVGQMEPVSKIEFTIDTIQSLEKQLASMSALTREASANALNSAAAVSNSLIVLRGETGRALNAIQDMMPNPYESLEENLRDIMVAKNTVSSSMSTVHLAMDTIAMDSRDAFNSMSESIQAISYQISAIQQIISDAPDQIGGNITDVSDQDTSEDVTGKVESCKNYGLVHGDRNVGGITGTVDWENDLDPENDFELSGERSMNFNSELRAVILNSENRGEVTAKKENGGGIVGRMALGLVKECRNQGTVTGEEAVSIGGIAGVSTGYLRGDSAKCYLKGESSIGGIAGSASVVTDCLSMVSVQGGKERIGTVVGKPIENCKNEETPFVNNRYVAIEQDWGGIDGVSYAGSAEVCTLEEFAKIPQVPKSFLQATVMFRQSEGTQRHFVVPVGEGLSQDQIPDVLQKAGMSGKWENLEETDLSKIYFDLTFRPIYTPFETAIRSVQERENGTAVALAQGKFSETEPFSLEPLQEQPPLEEGQSVVEGWTFSIHAEKPELKIHTSCPEGCNRNRLAVLVCDEEGHWRSVETTTTGSYLVFDAQDTDTAFCLIQMPKEIPIAVLIVVAAAAAVVIVGAIVFVAKRKKQKKNKKSKKNQS